ncbi:hypothetical protein DPEC_G00139100 [Dallia pectoralis]|uniref:Uncharacterized protein n=1 Tax=Dallia pectoralis TaxID=75939 RepID=A0ACC2GMD1_DALPE|nr:hypothetical protein DPEC_G00139100 [Dallia pectoralis]
MKPNQERSNGCLPPKKREILALEQRPVVAAPLDTTLHTENLAWLASVASERCRSSETPSPKFQVPSSSSSCATSLSTIPLSCLPAVYSTAVGLSQQGGTIQYAQLAPSLQFISSGPYAGYISSQVIPSSAASVAPSTGQQRPHLEGHCYPTALISQPSKDQQQLQVGLQSDLAVSVSLPSSVRVAGTQQYIQLDTPLTVTSTRQAHLQPFQLHPHTGMGVLPHTLTLAPSQVLVQYADGSGMNKSDGGHTKVVQLNGELERSFGKQIIGGIKGISSYQNNPHGYETRHILLPEDYNTQDSTGLQTSLLLVANNNSTNVAEHNKVQVPPPQGLSDKAGICSGIPVSRSSSFTSLSSSEALKISSAPQSVIQTAQQSEEVVRGLFSTAQAPIIGYIASSGHPHGISYATLPQHLVIQIPVSGAGCVSASAATDLEASRSVVAMTATSAATPYQAPAPTLPPHHTYLTPAPSKCEPPAPVGQVLPVQQIQTPYNTASTVEASPSPSPTPAPVQVAPSTASPSVATLPPFFMRGSIIQLADGELKRVEDLKTEDFIQSAEISGELKIDSSTVERIDTGQTPNAVVIQFAVGELKAQVSVEVLLEYPFFVFGQGWSSCCPDRTTRLFELSCARLCVGDVCVSLTLRSLSGVTWSDGSQGVQAEPTGDRVAQSSNSQCVSRTDSQRDSPGITQSEIAKTDELNKQVSVDSRFVGSVTGSGLRPGPGHRPGSSVYQVKVEPKGTSDSPAYSGNGQMSETTGNGETLSRELSSQTLPPPPSKTERGDIRTRRKRRWSAPERDQTEREQTEKRNEELPVSLPKLYFVSQEVKLSIEGRSNIGR